MGLSIKQRSWLKPENNLSFHKFQQDMLEVKGKWFLADKISKRYKTNVSRNAEKTQRMTTTTTTTNNNNNNNNFLATDNKQNTNSSKNKQQQNNNVTTMTPTTKTSISSIIVYIVGGGGRTPQPHFAFHHLFPLLFVFVSIHLVDLVQGFFFVPS